MTHGHYVSQTPLKKIMLPSLQSPHKSIKLFVIGGVVDVTPFEFLTKIGYGVSFLEKHDPNTHIGCITLNLKIFGEVRKGKSGALINFCFKVSKAFS